MTARCSAGGSPLFGAGTTHDPHTERLIRQLDDSTGPSYDARAELIGIGSDAIPAIIDGLPSLGGFGQLTAIEVFADLGLAIRSQRAGGIVLTRPLFLLHDWLDLWHALPGEEWNCS
jgi:hypothetical protein